MAEMNSKNKQGAALITGAAIRIGRGIALGLADKGYDIALHYNSSADEAKKTADEIREIGAACELYQADLTDVSALSGLLDWFFETFPEGNLLVNNASAYIKSTIDETTIDDYDHQMALNLRAPFFLMQGFARQCREGNIINVVDNKIGFNQYHYAAYLLTKKALAELTVMAALEMAPGIRVNGIAPGVILPGTNFGGNYLEWRSQNIPVGGKGSVEDITKMVITILENRFVNGQIIVVDGGEAINNIGLNAGLYKKE